MLLKNTTTLVLGFVCLLCVACTAYHTPSERPGGVYHKVQEGETIHSIAKAYKVDVQTLISANGIKDPSQVGAHSVVFIPDVSHAVKVPKTAGTTAGVYHHIKKGETLYSIAKAYDVDVRELSTANNISDPTSIDVDRILHIPDAKTQGKAAPPLRTSRTQPPSITAAPPHPKAPARDSENYVRRAPKSSSQFVWPAKGKIMAKFGIQPDGFTKYNGITIEVKKGTPVVASEEGRVDRSGHLKFFGTTIIIKHAKYWTVYANLEKSMVAPDEFVKKGQQIALSGQQEGSGKSCLYFEIRDKRYKPKNPLFYLPR